VWRGAFCDCGGSNAVGKGRTFPPPLGRAGKELKFPPTFRRIKGVLSLEGVPFI